MKLRKPIYIIYRGKWDVYASNLVTEALKWTTIHLKEKS